MIPTVLYVTGDISTAHLMEFDKKNRFTYVYSVCHMQIYTPLYVLDLIMRTTAIGVTKVLFLVRCSPRFDKDHPHTVKSCYDVRQAVGCFDSSFFNYDSVFTVDLAKGRRIRGYNWVYLVGPPVYIRKLKMQMV